MNDISSIIPNGWSLLFSVHTKPLLPQELFIASITPKTPQIKPSIPGTIERSKYYPKTLQQTIAINAEQT